MNTNEGDVEVTAVELNPQIAKIYQDFFPNDCEIGAPENRGIGIAKSSLTKERYLELVQLGVRASKELITHGLQKNEYCEFGNIMSRIMQLE